MDGSLYGFLAPALSDLRGRLTRAEGQALIEAALVISLASMLTLGTISMTGTNVGAMLGKISGSISAAQLAPTTTAQTTTPTAPKTKKKKSRG